MARREIERGEHLYIDGRRVPFTFWPENYLKCGPVHATNPWQCLLALLESDEACLLRCRAHIQQSYDFHVASKNASVTTMPLMLYYSYMNLAKAFLLHREGPPEEGLHDHHGLIRNDPPGEYGGLDDITFRVRSDDGHSYDLFPRLVKACGFPPVPVSRPLSLGDMIYQLPGIHDAHVATTGRPRAFYPVTLEFRHRPAMRQVWVRGKLHDAPHWDDAERQRVEQTISGCADVVLEEVPGRNIEFASSQPATYERSPEEVLRQGLVEPLRRHLSTEQTPTGFRYHLICRESFTAQVAANYAVMFVLGMIVRYCPEFTEKLRGEWLVHEYLATQPTQFAYLLASGFIRNEILPTPLTA